MPAATSSNGEPAPRFRAARACKACHTRRVKCDAVERGCPCTRCQDHGLDPCVLIESKRGTYSRRRANLSRGKTTGRRGKDRATDAGDAAATSTTEMGATAVGTEASPISSSPESSHRPRAVEPPAQGSNVSTSQDAPSSFPHDAPGISNETDSGLGLSPESRSIASSKLPQTEVESRSMSSLTAAVEAAAASLDYPNETSTRHEEVRPTDQQPVPIQTSRDATWGEEMHQSTPNSDATNTTTASSYREISWPAMFDQFLGSCRQSRPSFIENCDITYLGESFPLAMVLDGMRKGDKITVHYPGPRAQGEENGEQLGNTVTGPNKQGNPKHPAHMDPEDLALLERKGVFKYPSTETLASLQLAFLQRVYPSYPVVNQGSFQQSMSEKTIPWILLHSICFVSSTYCPLSVLHQAKFSSRQEARAHYYKLAKALFDSGYEVNKVVVLQSTMLLAFFAGGPNEHWNFYSWNSMAVTIAETLGIHRSLQGANMSPHDKSLLRRLWWILFIRDASCGALFGRPFRISLDTCDAEMLSIEDFEHDASVPEAQVQSRPVIASLYQIHMARLSLILRRIISSRFGAHAHQTAATSVENLNYQLRDWHAELPIELRTNGKLDGVHPFALCLAILYNHHLILANIGQSAAMLDKSLRPGMFLDSAGDTDIVNSAARRIMSLASIMVRRSMTLYMPQEAYPGIFLAQVVFYTQSRSSQPLTAQLGSAALANCQVLWHSISEVWDSAPWVMRLFDNLMVEEDNPMQHDESIEQTGTESANAPTTATPDFGLFVDTWQMNPMLSSVMDMSLGNFTFDTSNMGNSYMMDMYENGDMAQYDFGTQSGQTG